MKKKMTPEEENQFKMLVDRFNHYNRRYQELCVLTDDAGDADFIEFGNVEVQHEALPDGEFVKFTRKPVTHTIYRIRVEALERAKESYAKDMEDINIAMGKLSGDDDA